MSGWKSKKMMSNDRFNISYSWTQPYTGWNSYSQKNSEMDRLEIVDNIVDRMQTYPDAERMLTKIFSSK